MARKKNEETPVRVIFSLPESVAVKLRLYCTNPSTGRAFYDNRSQSKLVETLLREFFTSIASKEESSHEANKD